MNVLELVKRQQQKKQALKTAQACVTKSLTYRGVVYTR
jgi:hypothetical protein|tara:strand:- start:409 stop:522 length:114 start_codon:yes stop_codon:yes gene_type:complete